MAVLYQCKLPFNLIALENNIKTKELGFFKVCIVCTFAIEEDPLFLFLLLFLLLRVFSKFDQKQPRRTLIQMQRADIILLQ